jgi:hypothetical protein
MRAEGVAQVLGKHKVLGSVPSTEIIIIIIIIIIMKNNKLTFISLKQSLL